MYSQALVNQITDECCESIEDLLTELQVTYTRSNRRLFGPCPVHGGDNPAAWNLYPEGDTVRGIWGCHTRNCEKKWRKTLVGFVHAMLSKQHSDEIPWTYAVDWMAKFLGYKSLADVPVPDAATLERQKFNNMTRRLNARPKTIAERVWTPDVYRKNVEIPSPYYIGRNYSEEILARYDVGYSEKTNRSVAPIYNTAYDTIIGMTARTHWGQCKKCSWYHDPDTSCPERIADQINACKWKNSPGFECAHHLYNLWFARQHIMDSSTMVLVEGPGDVWRLEDAGIKNSVAIFGSSLTDEQLMLIESAWCMNVVVIMDNDDAGKEAAAEIKKQLQRSHRIYFPTLNADDVGELQTDQVTDDIYPVLEQIQEFNRGVGVK